MSAFSCYIVHCYIKRCKKKKKIIAQAENASSSDECICHVYNSYVNREDKLIQGYSLRDTENDAKAWLLVFGPNDDILVNKS